MSEIDLSTMRHSAAHVMAAAIQKLYPEAKFDIGPSTEDGFYYDVDLPKRLVPEDLKEIEKVMKKMLGQRLPFIRKEVSREEAKALFEAKGQTFKLSRLEDIPEGETVSLYYTGDDYVDLQRGVLALMHSVHRTYGLVCFLNLSLLSQLKNLFYGHRCSCF